MIKISKIKNKKLESNKKGYTLTELLIFMALLTVLLVFLTDTLGSILDVRQDTESISSVEQDGNYLLNRFMYDLIRAMSITTPSAIGLHGNVLEVKIGTDTYNYSVNNGNVMLQVNSQTAQQLNGLDTTITGLDFMRIGNIPVTDGKDTLQITFIVTSKIKKSSGVDTKRFQTSVGLR